MDELNSIGKDDLIKIILDMRKRLKVAEAEILRIRKLIQNL